ncbi:MAG: hypothetical protein JSV88_19185 [Candidatus Aminicenantes bacterium]|nr:MAG: hypothetical protein JSV88_19185 [Candidatus Aminicenantes bacterium]
MIGFFHSFSGEYKRYLYRIYMGAWAIILGIMMFQANSNVNVLKHNQNKINAFKKIQKPYFEILTND